MKINKILLLCLLTQCFSLHAIIIATWKGTLFLRVLGDGGVVITNKINEATDFNIKPLNDVDGRVVITGVDQTDCLYFNRMTECVQFGSARLGKIFVGFPIPDTPFYTISYYEVDKFLRFGSVDGEFEITSQFFSGRAWWMFITRKEDI
jgi:hypothetical protein